MAFIAAMAFIASSGGSGTAVMDLESWDENKEAPNGTTDAAKR